jgi:putative tryptophan/tyrosine transport system substrate-binding protein
MSLNTGTTSSFQDDLAALGYVDGKTVSLHLRYAEGRVDRLPALAAELVRLNVDVIVAWGVEALEAVRKATKGIPIVMVAGSNPVASELVASLARPGGNITGVTVGQAELAGKRLQLLQVALPQLSRVAILVDRNADPTWAPATEVAARALKLHSLAFPVRRAEDFDGALRAAVKARAGALLVNETAMLSSNRARLADAAVRNRLPAIGSWKFSAQAGYLMSYGPDSTDLFRRAAALVSKILRDAKPADLPVEQPTKFELVINAKTAKVLGLTIPPSLLARADQVIE